MKKLQEEPGIEPESVEADVDNEAATSADGEVSRPVADIQAEIAALTNEFKDINTIADTVSWLETELTTLGAELAEVRDLEEALAKRRPAREIEAEIADRSAGLRAAIAARAARPAIEARLQRLGKELEEARTVSSKQ